MEIVEQYLRWLSVPDARMNLRHIGSDLILSRTLPETAVGGQPIKMTHHMLVACRRGTISGSVNLTHVNVCPSEILVVVVGQLVSFESATEDFDGYFVLVSPKFMKTMDINMMRMFPLSVLSNIRHNTGCTQIQIKTNEFNILISYFRLMFKIMTDESNPHREQASAHLLKSFMMEAGYFAAENPEEFEREQSNPIVSHFLAIVAQEHCRHRELSYYAERLSLSESQVYRIIKGYSGHSAKEWIEDYTIAEAKSLLASTNLTIQQIAEQMNFPSQSFFGKFFKRVAGISPSEYRKSL